MTPTDSAAPLASDLPCRRCGYSLRGLHESGVCPECASPVADSLRGDLIRFASPRYVAALARGARLVWWSAVLALLTVVLIPFVVLIVVPAIPVGSSAPGRSLAMVVVPPAGMLLSSGMALAGWWLVSAPDPGLTRKDRGSQSRSVLRAALAVAVVGFVVSVGVLLTHVPGPGPATGDYGGVLAGAAGFIGGVAWVVQFFASMTYVRVLAGRIPDSKLARRALAVTWGTIVVVALGGVSVVARWFSPNGGPDFPACGVGLGVLVLIVMYILLVDRLKSSLAAAQNDL